MSGVAALSNLCLQRQAMLLDVATCLLCIVRFPQRVGLLLSNGTDAAWSTSRSSTMSPREACAIQLHRTRGCLVRLPRALHHLLALVQESA
jgi:hypothetical protein